MQGEPLIHITNGTIRGRALANGGFCFAGIPFAAPPIGPLRFRPPQPVAAWTGVREAVSSPPAPIQRPLPFPGLPALETSEDCLYLNVWTPEISGRRPVMVWIYGGGFETGSGSPPLTDGERALLDAACVCFNEARAVVGEMAEAREMARERHAS